MNTKLFFVGMFVLSSFSTFLFVNNLHLPCLIELLLIPIYLCYRRYIVLPFKDVITLVLFVLLGTFIGLLNYHFQLIEILQMSRLFFLGGLGFILLKNNAFYATKSRLLALTSGVFVGDLINSFVVMKTTLVGFQDKEYAVDINIILSILWPILIIFYKKSKWLLLVLLGVPMLCFLSVSRGISTFFLIGIILAFLFKTLKSPSKMFVSLIFLIFSFFALSNIYKGSESAVEKFSPSMHFRLYAKVQNYGKTNADKGRIAPYLWLVNHLDYYALPRGFQGKKFIKENDDNLIPIKNVWDSAYLEVIYTFGLLPFLTLLLVYFYKLYQLFVYYQRTGTCMFAIASVMFLLLLVEHFFGYGLYRSPFTVFSNGALLGFIWHISEYPMDVLDFSENKNIEEFNG